MSPKNCFLASGLFILDHKIYSLLFLDEEHGRIELDNYKFDDYIRGFGMDEENFEFSILGKQLTKADVKIYF